MCLITTLSSCGSSSLRWWLWTSESKCSRSRRRRRHWCLLSCDRELKTAPKNKQHRWKLEGKKRDKRLQFWSTDLPPHEDIITVIQHFVVEVIWVEAFGVFVKSLELSLITGQKTNEEYLSPCISQPSVI